MITDDPQLTCFPVCTDGELQRPDGTLQDGGAAEHPGERACGPESGGVSSGASEGDRGGGAGCGLELGRLSSETYLTASDDSSSLFDDDMQRAERPGFGVLASSEATPGGCEKGGGGAHRTELEDCSSEELNKRFQSQRLDSSSSSSETNTPSPILTPALTPKRPNSPHDLRDNPASPKQPRLRTPAGFGLTNVALAKKHLSQPPISVEAPRGQTRNALSMLRPLRAQETDLDQEREVGMETGRDTPPHVLAGPAVPSSQASAGAAEERQDCDGSAPPTPPLHRLPSWVRSSSNRPPPRSSKGGIERLID